MSAPIGPILAALALRERALVIDLLREHDRTKATLERAGVGIALVIWRDGQVFVHTLDSSAFALTMGTWLTHDHAGRFS